MDARYNVYFAGQLLAGHALVRVRDNIARLFNADDATLDKLFSGKPQLIKRDCDKATALKYKQAMEQAGALPVIKAIASQAPTATVDTAARPMTAAERIAALAAAPDLAYQNQPAVPVAPPPRLPEPTEGGYSSHPPAPTYCCRRSGRRPRPVVSTHPIWRFSPAADACPTIHRHRRRHRIPATSAPEQPVNGCPRCPAHERRCRPIPAPSPWRPTAPIFRLRGAGARAPVLDLSGIALAAPGADVLEQRYRNKHDQPPPATDHLALED